MGRVWAWAVTLPVLLWAGCGGEAQTTVRVELVPSAPPAAELFDGGLDGEGFPDGGFEAEGDGGTVTAPEDPPPIELPPPSEPIFQPGFFQNLRASRRTEGRVTLRYTVPVLRSGGRLKVVLLAGNSSLTVHEATVARAGSGGSLSGTAKQLKFSGQPTAHVPSRQRLASDPLSFEVDAPADLVVSLDVDGGVGASLIDAFPNSFLAPAGQAWHTHVTGAQPHHRLWGLNAILVEGPAEPVFLAIGDSITEGYVSGHDDVRDAWPHLAAEGSLVPVANGAVSGQGVYSANELFGDELQWLSEFKVTHCLVMLGTNDLAALDAAEMKARIGGFFDRLRPLCEVWAGTLIPREKAEGADLAEVHARRADVNAWLRAGAGGRAAHVVDFEAVTCAEGDPNRFRQGFSWDGIHPTLAGQRAMGELAAQELARVK